MYSNLAHISGVSYSKPRSYCTTRWSLGLLRGVRADAPIVGIKARCFAEAPLWLLRVYNPINLRSNARWWWSELFFEDDGTLTHCNDEDEDKMMLLAFVEAFIQMLLAETNCVVPVVAPIKVERVTVPGYDFGSVIRSGWRLSSIAARRGAALATSRSTSLRSLLRILGPSVVPLLLRETPS
jgi:hypothetical protein